MQTACFVVFSYEKIGRACCRPANKIALYSLGTILTL